MNTVLFCKVGAIFASIATALGAFGCMAYVDSNPKCINDACPIKVKEHIKHYDTEDCRLYDEKIISRGNGEDFTVIHELNNRAGW